MARSSLAVHTSDDDAVATVQPLSAAAVAEEMARLSEASGGRPITFGGLTFHYADVIALDDVPEYGDER